jgi:hypothetical protein
VIEKLWMPNSLNSAPGEKKPQLEHLFGKDIRKLPNQKWHQIVSFIKSGVRILGYVLIPYSLPIAAGVLIFSELIGIIEELV